MAGGVGYSLSPDAAHAQQGSTQSEANHKCPTANPEFLHPMTANEPNNQHKQPTNQGPAMLGDESVTGASATGGASAGVLAMHGHLRKEPKGFWADAWSQVLRRPSAVIALIWIGVVAFFAVFSPLIANGHPFVVWELQGGERGDWTSPLIANLTSVDVLLLIGGVLMPMWLLLPTKGVLLERLFKALLVAGALTLGLIVGGKCLHALCEMWLADPPMSAAIIERCLQITELLNDNILGVSLGFFVITLGLCAAIMSGEKQRSRRLTLVIFLALQAGFIALLAELVASRFDRPNISDLMRSWERSEWFIPIASAIVAAAVTLLFLLLSLGKGALNRILLVIATGIISGVVVSQWWMPPLQTFDYVDRERAGEIEARYALIPYSPAQRHMALRLTPPGETAPRDRVVADHERAPAPFLLGNDGSGQDLLSQLLHACRLSISIGLVATGIAVTIGVTLGSLMGYFGGWIDMMLYRLVEIVMAVPLLFVLIVAAAVLPKNIYVMMVIIGCFTWTNAARYTRAEFMRLREQDFVQAAKAVGLPMRSVLFRHMLPNGVTPVLVEASFAVAAAILIEAILSYLGLGPVDQASWGRLLAGAFNDVGDFIPWLAIFPGFAIFLMVLSLVLVGEALRDAIDPKLKKAAQA
jgi:peptide/nickel transport system permease protein